MKITVTNNLTGETKKVEPKKASKKALDNFNDYNGTTRENTPLNERK